MLTPHQGFTYNKFEKPNDWPKIDETFDYKIENGKLLSANEHIYLSGPVTYTKVGNPTINEGIASGFSSSNYLRTTKKMPSADSFEIVCAINLREHTAGNHYFLASPSYRYKAICLGVVSGNYIKIFLSSNGTSYNLGNYTGNNVLQDNTDYLIKLEFNGYAYLVSFSSDNGSTWTQDITVNSTEKISSQYVDFGVDEEKNSNWAGSIDLNNTYIKVNDQLWFYGKNYTTKNMVPVPAGLEYNNTTTPSIGWVNTNTDRVKGTVKYTKVGTPTITDGIASGFSNSNYLQLTQQFDITTDFECVFSVKTGSADTISNYQRVWFYDCNGTNGIWINNRVLYWWIATNNSNNVINNGNYTIQPETDYLFRARHSNGVYYLDHSIDNGKTWRPATSKEFTHTGPTIQANAFLGNSTAYQNAWLGSMDLNQTYITVNGVPWFGNCPSEFQQFTPAPEGTMIGKDDTHSLAVETPIVNSELLSPKLIGPVGYTVVGSPTINSGVVSGFSADNVLSIANSFPAEYSSFEQVVTFTTSNDLSQSFPLERLLIPGTRGGIDLTYSNSNLQLHSYFITTETPSSDKGITVYRPLSANTTYTGKFMWNGTTYTLELWSNGTKLGFGTLDNSNPLYITSTFSIGGTQGSADRYFHGSIDLNNTYIKVNGKLWFGKEDWTPSTYTDNAIYLLSGHKSDYSQYNELGINPTITTDSDEVETYNVWIDNQEIYKEQSNPLDINWNNLALTTGYNITTPTTLKAHVIKVEPNNGNITRFSTDTNYKVENGLLTWASPKLYLEGPTQYRVVGSPTIENGVVSEISNSNYVKTRVVFPSIQTNDNFDIMTKFKTPLDLSQAPNIYLYILGFGANDTFGFTAGIRIQKSTGLLNLTSDIMSYNSPSPLDLGQWYYVRFYRNDGNCYCGFSKDKQNWTYGTQTSSATMINSYSYAIVLGASNLANVSSFAGGMVDLNETYIKINNELWFGKIYTSETDVPVPANFTYGNTTTSSNGTVNLTTQEFSADTLATYGKDS